MFQVDTSVHMTPVLNLLPGQTLKQAQLSMRVSLSTTLMNLMTLHDTTSLIIGNIFLYSVLYFNSLLFNNPLC